MSNSKLPNKIQTSFTGGEFTPALYGQVNLQKYATGAKTLKNCFVHVEGGASNRPGTQFLYDFKEPGRLIPFEFNVEQNYALAFGDYTMLVLKDNAVVLSPLTASSEYAWSRRT